MPKNMEFKLEKPNIQGITPEEIFKFLQDDKTQDVIEKVFIPNIYIGTKLNIRNCRNNINLKRRGRP